MMFDDVPVRVWLLLLIALVAYAPARYLFEHIRRSPSRRDITQPAEDMEWRTSKKFALNLAAIVGLGALAIVIFTPTAEDFAESPSFWPILFTAGGVWALSTIFRGISSGRIEPLIRGISSSFERSTQPKRFWASVGWNMLMSGLFFWLAWEMHAQGMADRCYDWKDAYDPRDVVTTCSKLIDEQEGGGEELADLLAARARGYLRSNDWNEALKDYSAAIDLDPKEPSSFFNRALILDRIDDREKALEDYGAYIRLRPDDFEGWMRRGRLLGEMRRFEAAEADFSKAHELRPKDISALAYRGLTYAYLKDRPQAEQDFQVVLASEPDNPLVKRGRIILDRP